MTYEKALHAYQQAQQSAMSPRYMEKMVFARAVSMLKQARENIDDYEFYAEALIFNQRLWTYIQSNLTESGNETPSAIRTSLLTLSIFVDRQTISALAVPKAENVESLIDINIDISRGLDARPAISTATINDQFSDYQFHPN